LEELTAVNNNDGDLALFEFTVPCPAQNFMPTGRFNTNDPANLKLLGDLSFDPAKPCSFHAGSGLPRWPPTKIPAASSSKATKQTHRLLRQPTARRPCCCSTINLIRNGT